MKKYKKYSDRKKDLPVIVVRLCWGIPFRSAFLKGAPVNRHLTNFIRKDPNHHHTFRAHILLQEKHPQVPYAGNPF